MDVVITIVLFLVVLSVLVVAHEWGHFIAAKLCKMRVEDFSLFFGKPILRLGVFNGTAYNIRSIPLGGFVKIAGMEPDDISNGAPIFKRKEDPGKRRKILVGLKEEALEGIDLENISQTIMQAVANAIGDDSRLTEKGKAELQSLLTTVSINEDEHRYLEAILASDKHQPDPDAYNQKPLWQRAFVIFAGPFASVLFGYLLFCVMGFTLGLPDLTHHDNSIDALVKGKAAEKAGLKAGDRIVEINGAPIDSWERMVKPIYDSPGRPIHLTVQRGGERIPYTITPDAEQVEVKENGKILQKTQGRLGFFPGTAWMRYSLVGAVRQGTQIVGFELTMIRDLLFSPRVFTRAGREQLRANVGGPVAIATQLHQARKEGPKQVLLMGALLSVSVGVMNLLPIPIMDGGHLLLLSIEGLRRRKLSSREMASAQMIGICIIGVLFVLVMYNDIVRGLPGRH